MVVFYKDIIKNIESGKEHNYSREHLSKLAQWRFNDTGTQEEIDSEKNI